MLDHLTIAKMADACYESSAEDYDDLPPTIGHVDAKGDFARVWQHAGVTYVGVRGSDDALDWFRNLDLDLRTWIGDGKIHHGMRTGFENISEDVREILNERAKNTRLAFLAHSRGGPIAMQLAFAYLNDWKEFSQAVEEVVTFGSPPWTNRAAARSFSRVVKNVTRYEAGLIPFFRDPVPHALSWNRLITHVGDAHIVGLFGRPLPMHSMKNYIALLRDAAAD